MAVIRNLITNGVYVCGYGTVEMINYCKDHWKGNCNCETCKYYHRCNKLFELARQTPDTFEILSGDNAQPMPRRKPVHTFYDLLDIFAIRYNQEQLENDPIKAGEALGFIECLELAYPECKDDAQYIKGMVTKALLHNSIPRK